MHFIQGKPPFSGIEECALDKTGYVLPYTVYENYDKVKIVVMYLK